jgi:TrmH family RNA methyltransferase
MPKPIMDIARKFQKDAKIIKVVRKELTVSNIDQFYYEVRPKNKTEILSRLIDIYNPKTIRSTMGSLYRVPVIYVDDICEAADVCKSKDVTVYAAHLKGTDNYNKKDYTKPTAFMIGNEGNGLTDKLADKADEYVRIPMQGEVESLNAAVACTILTYEAVRQRL